jgi:hypothetical protein
MDPDAVKKTEDKKPLYSVSSSGEDYSNESFKKAKAYLIKHIASEGVKGMVALRDLFNEMDVNDDGTLSYEEVRSDKIRGRIATTAMPRAPKASATIPTH